MAKPDIQAVTHDRHGNKRWKKLDGFSFAATDALCPLVTQELGKAAMTMPIGFVPNDQDGFVLVGVLGINDGRNLFVGPDGAWQRGYIPAVYRGYPFMFMNTDQNQQILCLDEDSGVVSEDENDAAFFDAPDKPSAALQQVLDFHNELANSRDLTLQVCALFKELNLLKPWNFTYVRKSTRQRVNLTGLFQVDEEALNKLSDQDYIRLRRIGGVATAYCQLLSMEAADALMDLADAHDKGTLKTKDEMERTA